MFIETIKKIYSLSGAKWLRMHYAEWKQPRNTYCFPSGLIHLSDATVRDNWSTLSRGYDDEDVVKNWIDSIRRQTMVTYDGLSVLAQIVKSVEQQGISGKFIETGTWKGGAFSIMAKASQTWGTGTRKIWGFDSFEGIPEPIAELDDQEWSTSDMRVPIEEQKGRLRPVNMLVAGEEQVYKSLKMLGVDSTHIQIFKGWFQETFPKLKTEEIGKVALLRLDGDLYESTIIALEKFEPHLVSGGIVIVDDWGLKGARQAVKDYYIKTYGKMPMVHFIDGLARYIQKT